MPHPEPLTIAITGANSGIGLRAAQRLAADGHRILALCRDLHRGRTALEAINTGAARPATLVVTDLADPDSIDAAAQKISGEAGHLDVLINNAAVFDQTRRTPAFTASGHELFWATNHLGPFQLTARLSPLLAAAPRPRLINVASKGLVTMPRIAIRFDRLDDPGWYSPTRAYYHAKLAQIMTAYTLALRARDALDVACVRVPAVRLDADRVAALPRILRALYAPKNRLAIPAERLGETYAALATRTGTWQQHADPAAAGRSALRGVYVDENLRPVDAPACAYDAGARERLWTVSQQATGDLPWAR
ncbi:SDR family NAD(P)-dependent oxidoreductase [Planomonospora parontospora]|uniref:SDR family NAD(P)-dependent oxidoreductase n=1 Tax=Planomonospora parontospora TaxID=58119 RepID=UPI0016714CA0|nr:SDR family NAD(P)-dependent oxidoreductase [Planomonospora parontospora]GGL58738.1 dehydrogenase [Planomonospora parontospora subsp. antibiotica]GII20174.1 dehydrogenase [Planomonospora parontospora subsp. antibiotica]